MEPPKDNLVQRVGELAKLTQELAREAVRQYSVEVEAILITKSRDSRRIEICLDGMLDFCFDDAMLTLYTLHFALLKHNFPNYVKSKVRVKFAL